MNYWALQFDYNSNNAFTIENILRRDDIEKNNWYELIDMTSGQLRGSVPNVSPAKCVEEIEQLFVELWRCRDLVIIR